MAREVTEWLRKVYNGDDDVRLVTMEVERENGEGGFM